MAKLTRDDVLKLARLSRLKLTEAEIDEFKNEISAILGYVEQLQKAYTKDLKPTFQVTGLNNVMRKDEVVDYGIDQKSLLKNVPAMEENYIKVKRMIQ